MPFWGWMLIFIGGILFVGFVADHLSKKKRTTNSRKIQSQVDEVKQNNQNNYHHFL
ncbi:ACS family MFS transporter [Bacillus sinesaloumensis]|uniref:ACS family MFS transporter n=1 Tax=Litchfieldia sinesaloumensis TaxID=1926280 RepID=UPI0011548478|nr:ACS family MFS transporter [Bacillus sinesaloumensis]